MGKRNYYMIVTTPDDFKYDIQIDLSIIGLPDRNANRLASLKKEDKVIYYLAGLKCFAAISEVNGEYFYDDKNQIWGDSFELLPVRRKMKKILLCNDIKNALYIDSLIENLNFIKVGEFIFREVLDPFLKKIFYFLKNFYKKI